MSLDSYSTCAPARVKILLLPIGKIRQSQFAKFHRRLQRENIVRLGDVSPDSRPDRTTFSPLAFPDGLIYYDISQSLPPQSHLDLVPFEPYRLPLMVLGILDWKERGVKHGETQPNGQLEAAGEVLSRHLEAIREDYSMALAHRILAFDCEESIARLPQDTALVPPRSKSRSTTMKTVMCDLTAALLGEMSVYGKSLQERVTIETPRASAISNANGIASSLPPHMARNARPMSMAIWSGASSPTLEEKQSHRMSMPAPMQSISDFRSPSPALRGTSPAQSNEPSPDRSAESLTSTKNAPSRPSLDRANKSQDRSISSTIGDREREKGKARVGIFLGSLYLLAGRWPDAVRELSRSGTTARANSDYVWQAKAMDTLLIALLMCAWAGMDFKIPDILRPASELLAASTTKSKHSPTNSQHEISLIKSTDPEKLQATLRALANLIPDVVHNILNLHNRAYTFTEDKLPSPAYEHTCIRLCRLLTALSLSAGSLDLHSLRHVVTNTPFPEDYTAIDPTSPTSKIEIAQMVMRAFPNTEIDQSAQVADRLSIFAAISSSLIELQQFRRVAVILREMLGVVLPSLIQARKDDAAEMGIHPAASFAALNSSLMSAANGHGAAPTDAEGGMRSFLQLACRILGLPPQEVSSTGEGKAIASHSSPAQSAAYNAILNAYGSQDLKIDLLWACINVCESLPDITGLLRFSALLLRSASKATAPASESVNIAPSLSVEEQERLANNIGRAWDAAQRIGLEDLDVDYWDDFLVRDVEIIESGQFGHLTPHSKAELNVASHIEEKKAKNPFIHNPFQTSKAVANDLVLVSGEQAVCRLLLQNLFDFEIVMDSIRLVAEGVEADCPAASVLLGPFRTQTILVHVIPRSKGTLTIDSCAIKVRGCKERPFSIFKEPWSLKVDAKGKNLRLPSTRPISSQDGGLPPSKAKPAQEFSLPKTTSMSLRVIEAQPRIILDSISLPQSSIMLLAGERQTFTITLHNTSTSTPADLALLSFDDSTSSSIRASLSDAQVSASALHALEHDLAHHPVLSLATEATTDLQIGASSSITLIVSVLGKENLTQGTIQLDYAYLGVAKTELQSKFYTRQLLIPLTITVQPSVALLSSDLIRLDPSTSVAPFTSTTKTTYQSKPNDNNRNINPPSALLLLDLRNASKTNLTLHLIHTTPPTQPTTRLPLPPLSSTRLPILLPRPYLPSSHSLAPIPLTRQRQFVVSSTSPSNLSSERSQRRKFWYREHLLRQLSLSWVEENNPPSDDDTTSRRGELNLRPHLQLTDRMLEAYALPDIGISFSVPTSRNGNVVPTRSFLTLKTHIENRLSRPINSTLTLYPRLQGRHDVDVSRMLLMQGYKSQILPEIPAGGSAEVETGFVVLSRGVFEFTGVVEEVVEGDGGSEEGNVGKKRKGKSEVVVSEGVLEAEQGGRWEGEEICVIIARDNLGQDD